MEEFIMKKIYQYITILFVGIAALSSCADDNEIQVLEQKVESATIKLNFQTQSNRKVVNSRATEAENKLFDLHFYVFSAEDKSLTGYAKLVSESGVHATRHRTISTGCPARMWCGTPSPQIHAARRIHRNTPSHP